MSIPLPPIHCHIIMQRQHYQFLWPPNELAQIEQRQSHPWCVDGAYTWLGYNECTVTNNPSIPLPPINCCIIMQRQHYQFLWPPNESAKIERRQPHPWCVDGDCILGWAAPSVLTTLGTKAAGRHGE